jgi:chromosome segregation protein
MHHATFFAILEISMTLKRLEMHGFKSFAKKAVFDFSAPVTAIVGPNGSGKSNVVEAIRFVLGEQSSKSLRSKSGADLIFKGSSQIGKMSRASVAITFDNTERIFNLPTLDQQNLSLDFDEITLSREVFADGGNTYAINGNEVRLKDIHELIASVNIGSSGHHIISQGEADRLLNAKPLERREMLEESLGLKLYQYRIKEAERKLDKTREHMREAESLRRELAPHIKFLKKQVEKIEKARELEQTLKDHYGTYLVSEQTVIARIQQVLQGERVQLAQRLEAMNQSLAQATQEREASSALEQEKTIAHLRESMRDIARKREEASRHMGRIEGMIESAERLVTTPGKPGVPTIPVEELEQFVQRLEQEVQQGSLSEVRALLETLKTYLHGKKGTPATVEKVVIDTTEFEQTRHTLIQTIQQLDTEAQQYETQIRDLEQSITDARSQVADRERAFYELQARKNELRIEETLLETKEQQLLERTHALTEEYIQAEHFVGSRIIDMKQVYLAEEESVDESLLRSMHHDIERMKIRLEDMGGGGGTDVVAEHDETIARDAFLEKEIHDLTAAVTSLEETIKNLREKLGEEFHAGITKINKEFETFFRLMFGGGEAQLSLVTLEKKKKKSDLESTEEQESLEEEEEVPTEQGIDIDVSLPRKKVKDLEMLSGGERSLTSIALLFALSQVNPPPFLVLDETDAALDEANSKKYGDMIENLARQTQLMVVTHNRETMSRADILYGVTLGGDDCSTLLSIKFEEAVKVAK